MKKLFSLFCITLMIAACQSEFSSNQPLTAKTHSVFIDIDVIQLLQHARDGEEVPQYVRMFNGITDHTTGTHGDADLITEVKAGEAIVWQLGNAKGVTITGIEYFIVEGDDAFALPGGNTPQQQADGSWLANTSPKISTDTVLKYNIHFTVNGKAFWWDPLVKISSQG